MKKILAVAVLLASFTMPSHAVTAIFRWVFAPNTSNPYWVSAFMNMTQVYQNAGPVPFPPGNTVLTISIDPSICPNTDYDPMGFEYEEYSVDGGISWTIMSNTWTVITMIHSTTTQSQIFTQLPGPIFDIGPWMEQVSCPKGG